MAQITTEQYKILAHSLGANTNKKQLPREYYRNRFCAGENHTDMPILRQLQSLGYMQEGAPRESLGGASMWWVTDAGISAFEIEFEAQRMLIKT